MTEEVEHKNPDVSGLDYLKNLLIIFNNCKNIDEINQIMGERLREILPDSYIIISMSDDDREYSEVKKIFGLDKTLHIIKKYLKYDPREYKYPIKKSSLKEIEDYTSGKLIEFENGLYEISNKTIPKVVSRTLEKMHDIRKTYGIGYSQNGIIYGNITILAHKEIESPKKTIIESLVSHASLIIQKKFIETNLKRTEDKYKQIAESLAAAIYIVNRDGIMLYTNTFGSQLINKNPADMINHHLKDIFRNDSAKNLLIDTLHVIETNSSLEVEREYNFPDKTRWVSTKIQPFYDSVLEATLALVTTYEITDKKLKEQELLKARFDIKESEKFKTDFIVNFAHEIRSLMNGVIGFAQLIKGTELKKEIDEYSDIINENSYNLLKLFNNIIDIAKIDAGIINLEYGEFGLNRFLEDIHNIFRVNPKVLSNELELKLVKESKDVILNSDEVKFRQIFINLIDNAIKFSDKGSVEFGYKVNQKKERVYFVKDSGIGITKENQDNIFKRFYQGEDINTRRYNGAGIGLSLVKGYVDVLKGKIWFESEKGKGTTFFFTIS